MNREHLEGLASDAWAGYLRETLLPWALEGVDVGADLLEVGPGPGRTTDVLRTLTDQLTAVEIDPELATALDARFSQAQSNVTVVEADGAAMPFEDGRFSAACSFVMLHHVPTVDHQDRLFAEVARVLRPGAWFVAADGLASDDLANRHHDDTYNPVDPESLSDRLAQAGFEHIEITRRTSMWRGAARRTAPAGD